jgi:transcriptional regulator with XRE-family HTH domain
MSGKKIYISKNIKYLRKKLKLSQTELGEKIGKTHSTIGAWENEQNSPPVDVVIDLCMIFNIDVDNILFKNLEQDKYELLERVSYEELREKINEKDKIIALLEFKVQLYEKEIKEKLPKVAKVLNIK